MSNPLNQSELEQLKAGAAAMKQGEKRKDPLLITLLDRFFNWICK